MIELNHHSRSRIANEQCNSLEESLVNISEQAEKKNLNLVSTEPVLDLDWMFVRNFSAMIVK